MAAIVKKALMSGQGLAVGISKARAPIISGLAGGSAEMAVKDPVVATRISKQYWATVLESVKPNPELVAKEYAAAVETLSKPGEMTVAQAGKAAFFALEVYAFYCLGECVGRGSLSGYDVK
mmetsp:Transcript_20466/g.24582  ORF Transcript_20466/g.24582 Transcript_20466/m.24582 type:complete len:121 (-) Transcript_20466:335-697(-)|eukprot:CAMPEP_0197843268 /NCGR_PEP_ID=MMETSP1438-20131217/103_1 /TAXON_ID=1461541 /ORGANISM="Pterosperma sp., Strain CCMP1384" /LENGTH=120 /DNA_ID=CAMNT_0043453295 /DNA_START=123 /DNA_END=485 /DNA_ORIENTATION=-